MRLRDTFQTAAEGLTRNKSRSLLTTLGIIIGVGSVVLMVSIGASFQQYILDQVGQFGGNMIEIHANGLERNLGSVPLSLTFDDADAIRKVEGAGSVAPVIFLTKKVQYGREEISPMSFGTTKEIFANWSLKVQAGRLLSDSDISGAKPAAVIGGKAAKELFKDDEPIGKKITIGDRKFTVVGVLKEFGSPLAAQMDNSIYVPITVTKAMMGRTRYIDYISVASVVSPDVATKEFTEVLRRRHKISNPENDLNKDDFTVRSAEQAVEIITTVTLGITIFLALIAGISLLVGGIGIMNIMLVAVTERTKEIGLRKAVGAKRKDIMRQFLIESMSLTLTGGIIGILGGTGLGFLLALGAAQALGSFSFSVSLTSIALSLGMALGTGLLFGLYPARRAANLNPIEALRFE